MSTDKFDTAESPDYQLLPPPPINYWYYQYDTNISWPTLERIVKIIRRIDEIYYFVEVYLDKNLLEPTYSEIVDLQSLENVKLYSTKELISKQVANLYF